MAFPQAAAYNTSNEPSATLTHTVSLPSGIQIGDLLVVIFGTDGDNTCTWSDDFIEIFEMSDTRDVCLAVAYKIATGSEGGTITVTTTSSEQSSHISYRITGHDSATAPEASTGRVGDSNAPDPDTLTPTGGAKDYLWIACEGNDHTDTIIAYPLNYDDNQYASYSAGNGGCGCGVATRELFSAGPEDPLTFGLSGGEQWSACTVVVHPTAGGEHGYDTMKGDAKVESHGFDPMKGDVDIEAHGYNADLAGGVPIEDHGFDVMQGDVPIEDHDYATMKGDAPLANHGFDAMQGGTIIEEHSYATMKGNAIVQSAGGGGGRQGGSSKSMIIKPS